VALFGDGGFNITPSSAAIGSTCPLSFEDWNLNELKVILGLFDQ